MKKMLLLFLCTLPLIAGNLVLQEGFVAAHTEMVMDKTIDPLNNRLRTDLNMDSDDISSLKGTISVETGFFSSDNSDRDKEMYETLDSSAFPLATYTLSKVSKSEGENAYTLSGMLDFHGLKKELDFDAEITLENNTLTINATSMILMSDFGVKIPCMMFMCVRDQIDLFAKAVLLKQ
jgi:polyisoprenoid-binding protein YceI